MLFIRQMFADFSRFESPYLFFDQPPTVVFRQFSGHPSLLLKIKKKTVSFHPDGPFILFGGGTFDSCLRS